MKTLGSEAAATNPQGAQPVIIFQQPQHCPSKMAAAWNIALIGTHPASAGCGVGGVMVDFASERAGTDDVWVYTTYETRVSEDPEACANCMADAILPETGIRALPDQACSGPVWRRCRRVCYVPCSSS
jgi:hypothetical protein